MKNMGVLRRHLQRTKISSACTVLSDKNALRAKSSSSQSSSDTYDEVGDSKNVSGARSDTDDRDNSISKTPPGSKRRGRFGGNQ